MAWSNDQENHGRSGSNPIDTQKKWIGDFFSFVLVLVDRVIWYVLLMKDNRYLVELV